MVPLASLEEIAALDVPLPDVVVVALERLSDAPAAVESLLAHKRDQDWCVLNLRQVTVASTLADLLVRAEHRTGKLARAMVRMVAATQALEDAGGDLQRLWPPVGFLGTRAIHLAATDAMGRLDATDREISQLLDAVGQAKERPHPSYNEGKLLGDMDRALLSLRGLNRSVQRRMGRLHRAISRIEDFNKRPEEESRNAIPSVDPQFRVVASAVAVSTRELLVQLTSATYEEGINLVFTHQNAVHDHLSVNVAFHHGQFSGPMQVRSLRDLEDVNATSMPHRAEVGLGLPARRVMVHLRGLNILSHANTIHQSVSQGIEQRGWMVQGLNALTIAQNLDARIADLGEALDGLIRLHAIGFLGVVHQPDAFVNIRNQTLEIENIMGPHGERLINCQEIYMLTYMVRGILRVAAAPEPKPELNRLVCEAIKAVGLARSAEVLFRY